MAKDWELCDEVGEVGLEDPEPQDDRGTRED